MAYEAWRDSNDIGASRLLSNPDAAPGPLMIVKEGECWCGCRTKTSRPGRYFTTGHNTRFLGRLDRAEAAGVPVTVNGTTMTAAEWRELLAGRPAALEKHRRIARRVLDLMSRFDSLTVSELREALRLTGLSVDALCDLAREVGSGQEEAPTEAGASSHAGGARA